MKSLAVAWTRPETVREDIARVLAMSGFAPAPGAGTAVIATDHTAPWLPAGVLAALGRTGEAAPSPGLTPETRVVLHLLAARADAALGVGGCLQALAARVGGVDTEHRSSPARATVANARAALDADVSHAFLIDATLVPDGPAPDAPRLPANLLLAGRDPVALDAAVAALMGLAPRSLPLLSHAEEAGMGCVSPDPRALAGDVTELSRRPLAAWRPETVGALARLGRRAARLLLGGTQRPEPVDTPWHVLRRESDGAAWTPRGEG
ncbi:hypothetical protein H8E07_11660 [bacterium]|nr:hypothetical protein [bacterium]